MCLKFDYRISIMPSIDHLIWSSYRDGVAIFEAFTVNRFMYVPRLCACAWLAD